MWLRTWRRVNHGAQLVGVYTGAATTENSTKVPQLIKDGTSLSCHLAIPFLGLSKGNEIRMSKK